MIESQVRRCHAANHDSTKLRSRAQEMSCGIDLCDQAEAADQQSNRIEILSCMYEWNDTTCLVVLIG